MITSEILFEIAPEIPKKIRLEILSGNPLKIILGISIGMF